jgi:alkylhydroperoxidase family enzyme
MLEFADTLTRRPRALRSRDIDLLRAVGLSDLEILHLTLGCSIFNYLNRVADGLGIALDYASELPEKVSRNETEASPSPLSETVGGATEAASQRKTERISWIESPLRSPSVIAPGEPENLYLVIARNPEASVIARAWRQHQLRATPALDTALRAAIGLFCAVLHGSSYSKSGFRRALLAEGVDPEIERSLSRGELPIGLSPLARAALEHAWSLTFEPWTLSEARLDVLRRKGLGDEAILRLTELIAYVSFECRVALGLGIVAESSEES